MPTYCFRCDCGETRDRFHKSAVIGNVVEQCDECDEDMYRDYRNESVGSINDTYSEPRFYPGLTSTEDIPKIRGTQEEILRHVTKYASIESKSQEEKLLKNFNQARENKPWEQLTKVSNTDLPKLFKFNSKEVTERENARSAGRNKP